MKSAMTGDHYISDVRAIIKSMQDRIDRNVEDVRGMEHGMTPVQEARFDVGTRMLMDLIRDLLSVIECWKDGKAAYRVTEKMMALEQSRHTADYINQALNEGSGVYKP